MAQQDTEFYTQMIKRPKKLVLKEVPNMDRKQLETYLKDETCQKAKETYLLNKANR